MATLPTRRNAGSSGSPAGAWCYSHLGRDYGPISFRELRELAFDERLDREDEVWREGSSEKRQADSVLGLFPKISESPVDSQLDDDGNPYASPAATILDGPPGGLYLPFLHRASFAQLLAFFLAGVGATFLGLTLEHAVGNLMFIGVGFFGLILTVITALIFLHRAWTMMSMLGAHFSGAKATIPMLFPLFNGIWAFMSLVGWARLWNRNVRTHPGLAAAKKVWVPIFFLFSLSLLVFQAWVMFLSLSDSRPYAEDALVTQVSNGVLAAIMISAILTWYQLCRSINFLAKKKS